MADGTLKFDLTDLYMAAPYFQRGGAEVSDAVSTAASTLLGMGSFWGNDSPGEKFGATYQPNQAKLLELLSIVGGEVSGISDGINKMAANYGIAENANVNKLRALEQEMD